MTSYGWLKALDDGSKKKGSQLPEVVLLLIENYALLMIKGDLQNEVQQKLSMHTYPLKLYFKPVCPSCTSHLLSYMEFEGTGRFKLVCESCCFVQRPLMIRDNGFQKFQGDESLMLKCTIKNRMKACHFDFDDIQDAMCCATCRSFRGRPKSSNAYIRLWGFSDEHRCLDCAKPTVMSQVTDDDWEDDIMPSNLHELFMRM